MIAVRGMATRPIQRQIADTNRRRVQVDAAAVVQLRNKAHSRHTNVKAAIKKLDKVIAQAAPKTLPAREQQAWQQQTERLKWARSQLASQEKKWSAIVFAAKDPAKLPVEINECAQHALALQDAMQKQTQMYQLLSTVLKARHEMAMSIIRNLQ